MSTFRNYARYYDLLYHDKDYVGEAKFIRQLLQTHAPAAKTILELGCGTGSHAALLVQDGYRIHGIDVSQEMLDQAIDRRAQLPLELAAHLQFTLGDIRKAEINQTFDVVLALFHVISYQTTNEDLLAAFATAKKHLKPGGIFIFDVWYGPAVLSDRPAVRVKYLEDEEISVTRIAEPQIYPNQNLVDVNYKVLIKNKSTSLVDEIQETHCMRYLFQPEVSLLLNNSGLRILQAQEWMSDRTLSLNTWGAMFIAGSI